MVQDWAMAKSRTLKSDADHLIEVVDRAWRDGFFGDLTKLAGLAGAVALTVTALGGAALGVVSIFDAIH